MATLIRHGRSANDTWHWPEDDAAPLPADGDVIISVARWQAQRAALAARAGRIGLVFHGGDDPAKVAEDLKLFGVVAVQFPQFTDGRGYSIARLLRERYGWRGELRAVGDIQRDQLFYLARCGFDAFLLRDGEDVESALTAFRDFSDAYQAAVDQPLPLFRRRASATLDA